MTTQVYPLKVSKLHFKNYCYLIIHSHTKEAVLIDPAWEPDKIIQALEIHQAKLVAILLTHYHFDHVNLAGPLAELYQVPVLMSKTEIEYYRFTCNNLTSIEHPATLELGKINITPLLTPGHTKGALSYAIGGTLFTGDTLFIEGCGICTGIGGDPHAMFDTLSHLKRVILPETKIYPGHSYGQEPGKTFAYLLKNNIYLQFTQREEFIAFRMRKKQQGLFAFK